MSARGELLSRRSRNVPGRSPLDVHRDASAGGQRSLLEAYAATEVADSVLTGEFRFLEHIVLAVLQLEGGCTFRPARFISPKFFVDQLNRHTLSWSLPNFYRAECATAVAGHPALRS